MHPYSLALACLLGLAASITVAGCTPTAANSAASGQRRRWSSTAGRVLFLLGILRHWEPKKRRARRDAWST
jgi:hypothetical protein